MRRRSETEQPALDEVASSTGRGPLRIEIAIVPSLVLRGLVLIVAVLVALSTAGQAMVRYLPDFPLRDGVADAFYLDREESFPTMYSSVMLLVVAALFVVIAHARRRSGGPFALRWAALAAVFVLLALDEAASWHEKTVEPVRELLSIERGPLFYAWIVPGAAAVAIFIIALMRFPLELDRPTRNRLWTAGAVFVGGAIGIELVGGWYSSINSSGDSTMIGVLILTVEEALEMLGVALMVHALLAHILVGMPTARWELRVAAP